MSLPSFLEPDGISRRAASLSVTGAHYVDGPHPTLSISSPEGIIRARLTEDLWECSTALADVLKIGPDGIAAPVEIPGDTPSTEQITIEDRLTVSGALLAVEEGGSFVVRAGTCLYCYRLEDSENYEPLAFGMCCAEGSGEEGSGEEGSGEEGSGEEGSGEEGSGEEGSGEEGSGECHAGTCDDLVPAGACWIGCDGCKLVHLTPHTDKKVADCTKIHNSGLGVICGIQVDDAGHVTGWFLDGVWYSPCGLPEP